MWCVCWSKLKSNRHGCGETHMISSSTHNVIRQLERVSQFLLQKRVRNLTSFGRLDRTRRCANATLEIVLSKARNATASRVIAIQVLKKKKNGRLPRFPFDTPEGLTPTSQETQRTTCRSSWYHMPPTEPGPQRDTVREERTAERNRGKNATTQRARVGQKA